MEILFENRYMMNKNRFIEWAKHPIKKNILAIIWFVIMIFTIFMSILSIMNKDIIFFIFYMLMSVFCIYRCFFRTKFLLSKQFKVIAINHGNDEWERVIQFGDSIILIDGNTKTEYQWSQVRELINDRDYLILVLGKGIGIRLAKNGFIKGTADAFLDFIKNECQEISLTTKS